MFSKVVLMAIMQEHSLHLSDSGRYSSQLWHISRRELLISAGTTLGFSRTLLALSANEATKDLLQHSCPCFSIYFNDFVSVSMYLRGEPLPLFFYR